MKPPTVECNKGKPTNRSQHLLIFMFATLFVIIVVCLNSIIEERNVTPAHYKQALELCKPNDGLKHFNVFNNDEWIKVTCNNGAVFTGIRVGGRKE